MKLHAVPKTAMETDITKSTTFNTISHLGIVSWKSFMWHNKGKTPEIVMEKKAPRRAMILSNPGIK